MTHEQIEEIVKKVVAEIVAQEQQKESQRSSTKPSLYVLGKNRDVSLEHIESVKKQYEIVYLSETEKQSMKLGNWRNNQRNCLLIPILSKSNLAKIALGIADNYETEVVQQWLENSMEVVVWREGLSSCTFQTSPEYSKMFVAYERTIQEFGISIMEKEAFYRRVIKEVEQPRCLTAEDVRMIEPHSTYLISRDTIITKLAKELIQERNIQLICE
ncbi:hypothetical protein ACERII_10070 [Evansella sp. AB-rgal1]|uniref:hypothetical protein n=1 Tax=Evansella sp. AB-rgal1 TaxID=3242696 RepID=UPI00359CEC46